MVIFYKKWKKYNEIKLPNNKMNLNNRKMKNHPPRNILDDNNNNTCKGILLYSMW